MTREELQESLVTNHGSYPSYVGHLLMMLQRNVQAENDNGGAAGVKGFAPGVGVGVWEDGERKLGEGRRFTTEDLENTEERQPQENPRTEVQRRYLGYAGARPLTLSERGH